MPKSPNQKLKLLYLMEIMLQQTDERHPMTVPEMIAASMVPGYVYRYVRSRNEPML